MNKQLRFNKRFSNAIREGRKLQTIRRKFEDEFDTVTLMYDGFALREKVPVVKMYPITIKKDGIIQYHKTIEKIANIITGYNYLYDFAKLEGFNNWDHFIGYIETIYDLPFTGILIKWEPLL